MTEKELRDSGKLYKPFGCEELRAEYVRAGKLVFKLNSLPPSGSEERRAVMHSLFGSMGKKCTIIPSFHCDLGYNIHIGDNFFANTGLVILDTAPVNIGNNVLIGPQVGIYAAYHPLDVATLYGLVSGLMMQLVHTKKLYADLYISQITAMLLGRILSGVCKALIFAPATFTVAAWATTSFVTGLPGIVIQLVLLPTLVVALTKARLLRVRYA